MVFPVLYLLRAKSGHDITNSNSSQSWVDFTQHVLSNDMFVWLWLSFGMWKFISAENVLVVVAKISVYHLE